jgi:hypothetical protein
LGYREGEEVKPRHAVAAFWLLMAFAAFAAEADVPAGFALGCSLTLWLKWSWIKEHA